MSKSSGHHSFAPPLWFFSLGLAFCVLWVLVQLKELVVLLVVGYCLAYVINPFLGWLEKRKVNRTLGFFVVTAGFAGVVVLLGMTALPTLGKQYDRLSTNFPAYVQTAKERALPMLKDLEAKLPSGLPGGFTVEEIIESPASLLQGVSGETVKKVGGGVLGALLGGYSLTLTLLNLTLLPFIVFYLAVDFAVIHRKILELIPVSKRKAVAGVARQIDTVVSAFVRGQFTVGCILFALYALGLGIVSVELWFLLAILSGFGNVIPYFGFLIGIVLSTIMALVTFGSFAGVVKVWVIYAIVQSLEGTLITPKIVGDKVGLSPLAVILALFAGGQLFGLLGVLLAVPGAAVVKVLAGELYSWVLKRT
jgi:predicted PurR-regulated permease PerM